MIDIELAITQLVQQAPTLDANVIAALLADLAAVDPDRQPLARAIATVVERLRDGHGDPGIALPALAMACATLANPQLGERELEAARYEIETLLPVPGAPPAKPQSPDVPLTQLTRGRRPQT
jgi:hypothetical protein